MSPAQMDQLQAFLILSPIVGMVAIGLLVIVHSAQASLTTGVGRRRLFLSLTHAVMVIGASLFLLAMVQHLVGFHPSLAW